MKPPVFKVSSGSSKESTIFQSLPIGVLELDDKFVVVWASSRFLSIFTCKITDVVGRSFDTFISVKDRKGQIRFYSQFAQSGNRRIDTHVSLNIAGRDYLVHLRMVHTNDRSIIVYIEDLLVSQNLTFKLLWDEEKFSSIVLSSGEGIVILDDQDRIVEFNRRFFEFMQFKSAHGVMVSEPALIEKNLFDLLGNSFMNFRNAIRNRMNSFRKHHEEIWYNNHCFNVHSHPTAIPIKGFTGNCIVFRDITSEKISKELTNRLNLQSHELHMMNQTLKCTLKELEDNNDKLKLLDQEKNHLVSVVAHDLRAPLSRIIGLTNLLLSHSENSHSELRSDYSNKILECATHLSDLIAKLLDKDAVEHQAPNIELTPTNIKEVLQQVVEIHREHACAKQILINQIYTDAPVVSLLDRAYLQLLYNNLLSNAVKFSKLNGTVEVKLYCTDRKAVTEITDSGPGFTQDELLKVFLKFQKFSAKPTANEESHGLGLSIIKRYVDLMRGAVTCESPAGGGAKFTVTFDLA